MFAYIIRRLMVGGLTLVVITFIVFALIRNMPGDPTTIDVAMMDPSRKINPEDFARMKRAYGLDKPWPQAYVKWAGDLLRLDLGRSFTRKEPVTKVIGEYVFATLLLSISSIALAYLIAIPLGLAGTVRAGKLDERVLSTFLYMLYSFPSFVAALFLQILFAVKLGWLPLYGMVSPGHAELPLWERTYDIFLHSLMPLTCYTYGLLAYDTRFIFSNMQEVIRQDYIRTARAKGVGPVRVIVHHAFRNTLIPLVTMLGIVLPSLLSGSIIIEQIFSWPGMGQLFFQSITTRDYPVIMGLTLMFAVLTLIGQLLADVLYAVVDPRVRVS